MKVALITGAASGIGLALSLTCLQKGMQVVMTDIDESKLSQEALSLKAQFPEQVFHIPCDITKAEDVEQLVFFTRQHCNQVDWIFNNAGIMGRLAPVWELDPKDIHRVMEVNLYGMIQIIRAFIPLLFLQNNNAHFINIASLYALCSGSQMAAYTMSKHAVLALSESLYFDLKRLNKPVEVSVVFPSFTDTSLLSNTTTNPDSKFHDTLRSLLSHSRPALEVAEHIISEVEQKRFYIFPDKDVKGYCEDRIHALLAQESPHLNNLEQLIRSLLKRSDKP